MESMVLKDGRTLTREDVAHADEVEQGDPYVRWSLGEAEYAEVDADGDLDGLTSGGERLYMALASLSSEERYGATLNQVAALLQGGGS